MNINCVRIPCDLSDFIRIIKIKIYIFGFLKWIFNATGVFFVVDIIYKIIAICFIGRDDGHNSTYVIDNPDGGHSGTTCPLN